MKPVTLIRYGEIGLKGKNQSFFINQLKENITRATNIPKNQVLTTRGRIYLPKVTTSNIAVLRKVFGISSISPALLSKPEWSEIKKAADVLMTKENNPHSFKVEARREDKSYPETSPEINARLGEYIIAQNPSLHVNLTRPEITLEVEIRSEGAFLTTERTLGPGGLPVGVSGRGLALISGGIDSPVAAWFTLKRGLALDFIHFTSPPYTGERTKEKIRDLARILTTWKTAPITIFFVQLTEIQETVKKTAPPAFFTILQRRFMQRIGSLIAARGASDLSVRKASGTPKHTYQALVTGDSLGQVASQTIQNLHAIDSASHILTLRPLVGIDKQEIINKAKQIGTYDVSILPHEDTCALFAPKHPATAADLKKVEHAESQLPVESLIKTALEKTETITVP